MDLALAPHPPNWKRIQVVVFLSMAAGFLLCVASVVLSYRASAAKIDQDKAPTFWALEQSLKQDHVEVKESLARIEALLQK